MQPGSAAIPDHVDMPIEPDGPYGGRLSAAVSVVPKPVRALVSEAGGMAELLVSVLWSAIRHPRGYWADVFEEMSFTIRRSWLSISIALSAFLVSLTIPSLTWVQLAGVGELYGPELLVQSVRTFTVWVSTLLVAGVIGAAITAELGSRKVREELDAMQVMGIDPVRTLVIPRIVSVTLVTTFLSIPATLVTVLSSWFCSYFIGGIDSAAFNQFVWLTLSRVELLAMVFNCFLAGLLIGTVCCYKGLNAGGGAMGLGRAVNQAVVITFVSLFVMQSGYNAVILGFFPDLGAFR